MSPRLTILASALVACAPAALAQDSVPPGEYIFINPGFKPETVSLSLQESCFGTQFRFAIVNRPHGSFLVEARRAGHPPRRPGDVAAIRRFLGRVRNVRFRGTKCVSADEIKIGLDGLLHSPPLGQNSQVSQLFTIRF